MTVSRPAWCDKVAMNSPETTSISITAHPEPPGEEKGWGWTQLHVEETLLLLKDMESRVHELMYKERQPDGLMNEEHLILYAYIDLIDAIQSALEVDGVRDPRLGPSIEHYAE
jgi:hypothetical protein